MIVTEKKCCLNKKLGKVELGDWEIAISKFPNPEISNKIMALLGTNHRLEHR
jgi:hypothetical protein